MRYGNASATCMLSVGLVIASACGSSGNSSTFETGTGGLTGGSGTLTGGSQSGGTQTGTINTNTGGSQTGTLVGTGTSSGTGSVGDGCAEQTSDSSQVPSDIFIMLDKSGSMSCPAADSNCENPPNPIIHPTRWEAFTQAVQAFVGAPGSAGIGVGIGYFSLPGNNACNVAAYAMPTVAIAPLPGNANAITAAIGALMPGNNTPTVPALSGAIQYARQYTMMTPGRGAAVVFITDGIPNGCNSTVNGAAMVAQMAFAATPSIKTYVIGLGNTMALDQIALAGSGNMTHYFPATGDVAGMLAAALTKISGQVTCDYSVPAGIDFTKVNVRVTPGGGMQHEIGYVGSAAMCGANGGWYYDNPPPATPTHLTLCPQSCDPLKATPNSKVQVVYGCRQSGPGIN